MSCDICGSGSCVPSFHSLDEQQEYEAVIDAFDRARDMRSALRQKKKDEAAQARAEEEAEQEARNAE